MLFGRPLRPEMSRRGSAAPDDRKAVNTRDAWTIDLTRYGSRIAVSLLTHSAPILLLMTGLIKRPYISLCEIDLPSQARRFFVLPEMRVAKWGAGSRRCHCVSGPALIRRRQVQSFCNIKPDMFC